MSEKEKAQELVEKFKDYVHGYIGSSMLTQQDLMKPLKIVANGWLYMLCDHHRFKLYTALTRIAYTTCYAQYGLDGLK